MKPRKEYSIDDPMTGTEIAFLVAIFIVGPLIFIALLMTGVIK